MTKYLPTLRLPVPDPAHRERLAKGAQDRAAVQEQLQRGEMPTGYRAEWLRRSAMAVITVAAECGERLDVEHPEQAVSLADTLDVLATARRILLASAPPSLGTGDLGE